MAAEAFAACAPDRCWSPGPVITLHRNTEAKAGLVVARTAIWPALNHPSSPELQLVYDTAPIGLAFLTPDCRYVLINQRLTEICGISITERGPVAGLVGIEGGVVSGVINLESPGVWAPGRRLRHEKRYHDAW
jgi:hypothetical protein